MWQAKYSSAILKNGTEFSAVQGRIFLLWVAPVVGGVCNVEKFWKDKIYPFLPPWQTPKTSSKTGSTFGTAHMARNGLGEQSKTPPLLQRRAVGQQPHARLSRLTTKSGSISSKPLLDPNRRSHSATSIQAKAILNNANNQRTQTQLLSSTAKSKLLLENKSSDDLLRNGTFNLQTSTKIKKKEVPVKTQQRTPSFTSRG